MSSNTTYEAKWRKVYQRKIINAWVKRIKNKTTTKIKQPILRAEEIAQGWRSVCLGGSQPQFNPCDPYRVPWALTEVLPEHRARYKPRAPLCKASKQIKLKLNNTIPQPQQKPELTKTKKSGFYLPPMDVRRIKWENVPRVHQSKVPGGHGRSLPCLSHQVCSRTDQLGIIRKKGKLPDLK